MGSRSCWTREAGSPEGRPKDQHTGSGCILLEAMAIHVAVKPELNFLITNNKNQSRSSEIFILIVCYYCWTLCPESLSSQWQRISCVHMITCNITDHRSALCSSLGLCWSAAGRAHCSWAPGPQDRSPAHSGHSWSPGHTHSCCTHWSMFPLADGDTWASLDQQVMI